MTNKQEIDQIMKTEGKVRGATLQTDAEYVKRHFGEGALANVKRQLADWGYPIDYENVQAMEWYPAGLRTVSLLAVQTVFNLTDEQMRAMGMEAPKYSFMVKLLMKFFLSLEQTFKNAPLYWKKHWTIGELELGKFDEKEKILVLQLKNFPAHPTVCKFEEGYFLSISSYAVKNARIKETKCMNRGDPYHEYVVTWD